MLSNRKPLWIFSIAMVGALTYSTVLAQASDGGTDPILVTDPAELTAAGFSADASNVYNDGSGQYFTLTGDGDPEQAFDEESAATNVFGPQSLGYSTIQPADMIASDDSHDYDIQAGVTPSAASGSQLTCPVGEDDGEFLAPVYLPQGSIIRNFTLRGYDTVGDDRLLARLKKVCQAVTLQVIGNPPVITVVVQNPVVTSLTGDVGSTDAFTAGNFSTTQNDIDDTVDNKFCAYHVMLDLENDNCKGNNIRFYKARVAWQRQISPGPGSATFFDVPLAHPFFKEVEALAASGITGGCGDGSNYCPNNPVTRGQMAAFLARALGLHFPGCIFC